MDYNTRGTHLQHEKTPCQVSPKGRESTKMATTPTIKETTQAGKI
jgi:hypothetical protein